MSSLKADFNELMERIKQGREFGHASFEPIFYLVFPPNQILNVKRETTAWVHRLTNEGWDVVTFSIAEHIADILAKAPLRKIWLAADQKAPLAWEKTNSSLPRAACGLPRSRGSSTRSTRLQSKSPPTTQRW